MAPCYGSNDCDTSAATCLTAMSNVWYEWVAPGGTTGETCATDHGFIVWQTWTIANTTGITGSEIYVAVDHRTPAQIAAFEAALAAERIRIEQARYKARALLFSLLTQAQRKQLERHRHFEVIAGGSRRRYRIHEGTHGNVRLLDDRGREVTRYCGQPPGVPTEDAMLAQKLQLECDEAAFLRLANATPIAGVA